MRPNHTLWNLGQSAQHRPLQAMAIAPEGAVAALADAPAQAPWPWVLCLGAVHGDEIESVWLVEEMRSRWSARFPYFHVGVICWAQVNPDGVALGQRWNGNKVDLNRNLPTKDWTPECKNPRYPPGPAAASEPETQALVKLIEATRPRAILSAHSFSNFQVNANGPSLEWAASLAKVCGYPVTDDIGYPTPGSLGTFAGKEQQIPTITLEIERGLAREEVLKLHVPVMEAAAAYWNRQIGEAR